MRRVFAFVLMAAAACGGGSKGQVTEPTPPGDTHVPTPPATPMPDAGTSATPPKESAAEPPPPAHGITIKNDGDTDLIFGITKGWGVAVFGYTGKPPKAKSVTLFEAACTASCEAEGEALCPVCPEPKDKKEEQAMAKIETVAAGKTFVVPWDGQVVVAESVKGKKRSCKCWRKIEPPADTYTIKGCGLRPPKEPGKPSKPVCTETQVTLEPGGSTPPQIILSFK